MRTSPLIIFVIALFFLSAPLASGKKKGIKLNIEKTSLTEKEEAEMSSGSFMVASECTDCNNGYRLNQITFSGYDKPRRSALETFFITNNTDRTLNGVTLYIDYRTLDGRQLDKKYIRLICNIPPGETRMADIKSWDKQKAFYYEKSEGGKNGGTPYTVIFDPVAYYLRF